MGSEAPVEQKFYLVDGCPTLVTTCGHLTGNTLILIIPGNPGVCAYYEEFMREIYNRNSGTVPIWCVSHAGHVTLNKQTAGTRAEKYHSLKGQIAHKLRFIADHVPANTRLILIGHSIGAYVILHMLDPLGAPEGQGHITVLRCMLLFPTIERMALSDKGRVTTPTLRYMRWLAPWLIYPPSFLPERVTGSVLQWYFAGEVPECAVHATKYLISPTAIQSCANMAHEEMQHVVYADYNLVAKHLKKLMFYYGVNDHWCPVEYYEDMKAKFPQGDIQLCKEGFDHAFVLKHSKGMAEIVWDWIIENIPEIKDTISDKSDDISSHKDIDQNDVIEAQVDKCKIFDNDEKKDANNETTKMTNNINLL